MINQQTLTEEEIHQKAIEVVHLVKARNKTEMGKVFKEARRIFDLEVEEIKDELHAADVLSKTIRSMPRIS